MKIAIVGTGIAGMTAAHNLSRDHEIAVYERADYVGGHTNTIDVVHKGIKYAIDTGFIVFNNRTYPGFVRLMNDLGVASQPTSMSFSVRCEATKLEYNGGSLNALFAQRRNLLRPSFLRMVLEILRFYRSAPELLSEGESDGPSLGEYLVANGYSEGFIRGHIVPMSSAIWSADPSKMLDFPVRFFVRFFQNHGFLRLSDRPEWRVIRGGSSRYVEKLTASYRNRIRLSSPVESIRRAPGFVEVRARGVWDRFDAIVIASHGDEALRMLSDPSARERAILGAFRCQPNEAVLHTDDSIMPRARRAWAAWNYHLLDFDSQRVALTYNMNILQRIEAPVQFCVTLNHADAIDESKIIKRISYEHPMYTTEVVAVQKRYEEVSGVNRTYYCGAHWGYGFHEDGVQSAMRACQMIAARSADVIVAKRPTSAPILAPQWATDAPGN